jgi:ERF superfamily
VCPVAETASPQRMGAALTYARRYALFTLVGIAGEDALDAHNLELSGVPDVPAANPAASSAHKPLPRAAKPTLSIAESAALRVQLAAELGACHSSLEALAWAQRILPTKNTLIAEEARALEQAFELRMAGFEAAELSDPDPAETQASPPSVTPSGSRVSIERPPVPKTPRRRDKSHLEYVASKPCLVCGRTPSDAHHLRCAEPRALGRKVSDEFAVPLCRIHHRELHDRGDEQAWWEENNINPAPFAQQLWQETRPST